MKNRDAIKELISRDRRKTQRLLLSLEAIYRISGASKWEKSISLNDLGGQGLSFISNQHLKKNTDLEIKIQVPNESQPILLQGRVARCKKEIKNNSSLYTIGVQFCPMSKKNEEKFITFFSDNILSEFLNSKGEII